MKAGAMSLLDIVDESEYNVGDFFVGVFFFFGLLLRVHKFDGQSTRVFKLEFVKIMRILNNLINDSLKTYTKYFVTILIVQQGLHLFLIGLLSVYDTRIRHAGHLATATTTAASATCQARCYAWQA